MQAALDAALPPGIDIVEVVDAATSQTKTLAERIEASQWRIWLPEVDRGPGPSGGRAAAGLTSAPVERPTKDGTRTVDVRAAILPRGGGRRRVRRDAG